MSSYSHPVTVLVVEDDDDHADLISRGLKQDAADLQVVHACNGQQALAFLRREGQYGDAVRPALVLLDLNMPRMNGHEVLAAVKSDPALSSVPIVVLSTSRAEGDVTRAYGAHANSYLVKPLGFQEFSELMAEVSTYWLNANQPAPAA